MNLEHVYYTAPRPGLQGVKHKMDEKIIRSGHRRGYIVLLRTAAQDTRLSLEARGLLALMMSLPDDWEYTVSGLAVKAGCGRDKIRRLLKNMQDVGYLIREQSHDAGGKFAANVYVLQEDAPPLSGNTVNGKNRQRDLPSAGFSTQQNIDLTDTKTQQIPPKPPRGGGRSSRYALAEDAKPLLREYCGGDRELAAALGRFVQLRETLRAVNSRAGISALLGKLDRLSGGDRALKLLMIQEAMANSWKSVFPLREGRTPPGVGAAPAVETEEVYQL